MKLTMTFAELGAQDLPTVGGKGANLGALCRAGVEVPKGYCVTTAAFDRFLASLPDAEARFAALERLDGQSVDEARSAAEAMRAALGTLPVPAEVAQAVDEAWRALGTELPLAVRSSATAEDLPGASFAGQQDTYLNVLGEAALIDAVKRCWISLFTDRAVLYRARGGFGHRAVRLAVVVQQMVDPEVSGILFTADPISGHRHVASIDAGFGLGEALVSGLISADLYKVDRRTREVLLAKPGTKELAIRPVPGGGTRRETLPDDQRQARALSDAQVIALAEIGDRVERFFGGVPQDIEWCIAKGQLYVVQARPITSLFPIPERPGGGDGLHVFFSFGHLQMMLDPMPRLARQVLQLFIPAGKVPLPKPGTAPSLSPAMGTAASRLYLDVTAVLRIARLRGALLFVLRRAYEALALTIGEVVRRPAFSDAPSHAPRTLRLAARTLGPVFVRVPGRVLLRDPARGAADFARVVDDFPSAFAERLRATRGASDRVRRCAQELNEVFWRIRRHISQLIAGFAAIALLKRSVRGRWADGVRDDVDLLFRGLPGNVTTEMDLAVGDLTDLLRPHPQLAALIRSRPWVEARAALDATPGGARLAAAMEAFLQRYGNRGAGEIDISRPRWRDDPSLLLRVMTGGLTSGEAGAHRRQHRAQVELAEAAAARLEAAAGRGLLGPLRRRWVKRLIRVARVGMGLREHPKFTLVQMFGLVRAEALSAAELLVQRGQLAATSDVWHLGFDELASALDDPAAQLRAKVAARAAELKSDLARRPPLVITSDGEIPTAAERGDLPAGALPGTPASAGVVEGVARVVTDPAREVLHAGEILVAPFTDPGWTPLFVHAVGVVTEVGGMMTHGAVVAREYGIPAVVSVASAVERIKSGQRIRVDGTRGFVQILEKT